MSSVKVRFGLKMNLLHDELSSLYFFVFGKRTETTTRSQTGCVSVSLVSTPTQIIHSRDFLQRGGENALNQATTASKKLTELMKNYHTNMWLITKHILKKKIPNSSYFPLILF